MTTEQTEKDQLQAKTQEKTASESESKSEKVLCPHCQRTATNGMKCQGICISDSDY